MMHFFGKREQIRKKNENLIIFNTEILRGKFSCAVNAARKVLESRSWSRSILTIWFEN